MKKTIRLTESELINIIKKIVLEQTSEESTPDTLESALVGENIVFFDDPQETKPLPEATITKVQQLGGQINMDLKFFTGKTGRVYFDCASNNFYKQWGQKTSPATPQQTTATSGSETSTLSQKMAATSSTSVTKPIAGTGKVFKSKLFSNNVYHSDLMNLLKNEYCTVSKGGSWIPKTGVLNR